MTKHLLLLFHFIRLLAMLCKPNGSKALIAENLLLCKQLITVSRKYKRSPNLSLWDGLILALLSSLIRPDRLIKSAIIIKPSTLLKFHQALIKQKYRLLFSSPTYQKPGPKGPSKALIQLIVEMKQRNPRFGCLRIAMQIKNNFNIDINRDIVRRVLAKYYKFRPDPKGPSWLSFIGHMKDSLWSIDLFRCESILSKTHWVMVVMDHFSRRIIGFAVHAGHLDGMAICYMFNQIKTCQTSPRYLSSDNDPLFLYQRWQVNLRILDIKEIKTIPYVPLSHPYIERLIKSIRQELLDQILFWNTLDLQRKLHHYQQYFNNHRSHQSLNALTPNQIAQNNQPTIISLNKIRWQTFCQGLFQLPLAA